MEIVVTSAALTWGVFVMGAASRQARMIFGRPKRSIRTIEPGPYAGEHTVSVHRLTLKNGTVLEGWCSDPKKPTDKVMVYFGGRRENVGWASEMVSHLGDWRVYAFNYRGFGRSEGISSESTAKSDCLEIIDQIKESEKDSARKFAIFGRSLGTSIAIYAAKERGCDHLILVTPFDSVRNLIKKNPIFTPWIKLLHENFYCLEDASALTMPTTVFLAKKDRVIPRKNSMTLAKSLRGEVKIHTIGVKHHNALPRNKELMAKLKEDLDCRDTPVTH